MTIELPGPKNGWAIPWDSLEAFPWVLPMRETPQDPIHHQEGDVWTHTRMVIEALVGMDSWRLLPPQHRDVLFWAAVLHDVAKPFTTTYEGDRIHSKGHTTKGAIEARRILWKMGYPFKQREAVCGLVHNHQKPYFILEGDSTRKVIEISCQCRCDHLALLAEADVRGRTCDDLSTSLESIAYFRMLAEDQGCLSQPFPFASSHSRFVYFRTPGRDPSYEAHDDTRCEVLVMSGLPGAGKDTWIAQNYGGWPVISLDDLREEMDIDPGDRRAQGKVAQEAIERLKKHLRARENCIWNATNLSRDLRSKVLSVLADYHARIFIVYVEAPYEKLMEQNRDRASAVPEAVIEKLTRRWQVPDLTEAHSVIPVTGEP